MHLTEALLVTSRVFVIQVWQFTSRALDYKIQAVVVLRCGNTTNDESSDVTSHPISLVASRSVSQQVGQLVSHLVSQAISQLLIHSVSHLSINELVSQEVSISQLVSPISHCSYSQQGNCLSVS